MVESVLTGEDGVTLTSLVCHTNNRAFGGNVPTSLSARWTNSAEDDESPWDPPPTLRLAISLKLTCLLARHEKVSFRWSTFL